MPSIDVFNNDAFGIISMTRAVNKIDYAPGLLGTIPGLFIPEPVTTVDIWIEETSTGLFLIQTTPRGAPVPQMNRQARKARSFRSIRLAQGDTLHASEIQGVRAVGTENEVQTMQGEIAVRQRNLIRAMELTKENLRLGAVQGLVLDADGSTLFDWATELGQTIPAEVDFDLDNASPASGALRMKCNEARRSIIRGLKGQGSEMIRVMALCGDTFFDQLTAHPEVRETYLHWQAAQELRSGNAFSVFRFGDIDWVNYRSTDDGGATPTVGIPTTKAKFFPVGAEIFRWALSPGESFEFVNTRGLELYSNMIVDRDRNEWAAVEVKSYPLPVCTMPQALYRARNT